MKTVRTKHVLPALAAIIVATGQPLFAAPVLPPSALSTAKTIEVQESFYRADETGQLKSKFNMTVDIAAGMGVKVLIHPADPKLKVAYYIANPVQEYEYYGDDNNYRAIPPTDDGHASSEIRAMGCVDLLQNSGKDTADDAKRTLTTTVLDGHKMILQEDAREHVTNGVTTVYTDDLWYDAGTGLPYRRTGFATTAGKTVANLSVDFKGWSFNKPLSSTFFDFSAPQGSKPLVTPIPIASGAAPDFSVIDSAGATVHLSDFKGKIVILDFWATWCGPCQQSMPHLDRVYKLVKDQDVVVLAVCVWDKKTLYTKWVTDKAATYSFPTAFDPAADGPGSNIAKSLYQVTAIPATYVIDKDGKIAAYISGYTGEGDHRLEDTLNKLGVTTAVGT